MEEGVKEFPEIKSSVQIRPTSVAFRDRKSTEIYLRWCDTGFQSGRFWETMEKWKKKRKNSREETWEIWHSVEIFPGFQTNGKRVLESGRKSQKQFSRKTSPKNVLSNTQNNELGARTRLDFLLINLKFIDFHFPCEGYLPWVAFNCCLHREFTPRQNAGELGWPRNVFASSPEWYVNSRIIASESLDACSEALLSRVIIVSCLHTVSNFHKIIFSSGFVASFFSSTRKLSR